MTESTLNDVDKLQEIIDILPNEGAFSSERREYSLTKGDVLLIYKIAKVANDPHHCPFSEDQKQTLSASATNIANTQKIAAKIIITAIVLGMITGIWSAVVHMIKEAIKR